MARTDDDSWDITERNRFPAERELVLEMSTKSRTQAHVRRSIYSPDDSWNSTIAVTVSTASLSAPTRAAALGAASTA